MRSNFPDAVTLGEGCCRPVGKGLAGFGLIHQQSDRADARPLSNAAANYSRQLWSISSNAVTAVTGSVDKHQIIYLTVEMRNRSKDGGRYAQAHYRDGHHCCRDAHYGMGGVKSSRYDQSARRRQRADARIYPVVTVGCRTQ